MSLKDNGKVRYMLDYLDIPVALYTKNNMSIESLLWAYMSKRVKEALGNEVSWRTDKELWGLYISIQSNDEHYMDKALSSFGEYSLMTGMLEYSDSADYQIELQGRE